MKEVKHYIIPIFVPHYGCPHDCVFCNQSSITGEDRENSTKEVINKDYIDKVVKSHLSTIPLVNREVEISFFGGTFTAIDEALQKELLSVALAYKNKGLIKYIRLSTRPDYINKYILNYLKEYSVDIIELGVQSMDNSVLEASGRGHDTSCVIAASKLIKDEDFVLGLQMMIGLPYDNIDKDIATTRELITLKPDFVRIYPTLIIKGTPLQKLYLKGLFVPYTLEEAITITRIIYIMFYKSNITVIRLGLQTTEEINIGKEIVGGPFHPSFRELVEGSIYNDALASVIISKGIVGDASLYINPKDVSKLYSNGKEYFTKLELKFPKLNIKVIQDINISRGALQLKSKESYIIQPFNDLEVEK